MQKQRQAKIVAIAGQSGESIRLINLCFVYSAKNNIDRYIKRIGLIEEVLKIKVRLFRESLSFLCVCDKLENKDKYA